MRTRIDVIELTGCFGFLAFFLVQRGCRCRELAVDVIALNDRWATGHEALLFPVSGGLSDYRQDKAIDLPRIGDEEIPEGDPAPLNNLLREPKPCAISVC